MSEDLLEPIPESKIYKELYVRGATFLGGPMIAGYFIAENFKSLGQPEKVKPTWIITILATIVIFGSIFLIPGIQKVPNFLIPFIYAGIAGFLVQRLQGEKIKTHIANGGQFYSAWRILLISLIGLATTIGLFLVVIMSFNKSPWH